MRYKLDPFAPNGISPDEPKVAQPSSFAMPGKDGATGAGVSSGGTTGQVLKKKSNTDYDTEWGSVSGSGGYAANVYPSNTASDISGYKKLSYTPDVGETIKTVVVNNNEVLSTNYIYDNAIDITTIPGGLWTFNFRSKVSGIPGVTRAKFVIFVRNTSNVETELFSHYSAEINNTDYADLKTETTQPSFTCNDTDRLGMRVYYTTTHTANITVNTAIGTTNASYLNTPIQLRHSQLREPNEVADVQHLTAAQVAKLDYINQDVKTTASPTFAGASFTGAIDMDADLHLYPHTIPADSDGTPRTTKRLIIDSYDKSNVPNGHAGDGIALRWRDPSAKAFIGWWDYTTATPALKAWIGAHDLSNNGLSTHAHLSLEVADSTGALQTRMEFPYDLDHTNIKTASADFTVNEGKLRIAAGNTDFKDIQYSTDPDDTTKVRWALRTDNTTESGSNVGSDYRIVRYSDHGAAIDTPFFVKRSNGRVGINNKTSPTAPLDVNGEILSSSASNGTIAVNRAATTNFGSVVYRTAGADRWTTGMRNDSTNDFHIRDNINGATPLKITQAATPTVTITGHFTSATDSTYTNGTPLLYWKETYTDKLFLNSTATLDGSTAGLLAVTGKIGIGGTPTGSSNLFVVGESRVQASGDNTADRIMLTFTSSTNDLRGQIIIGSNATYGEDLLLKSNAGYRFWLDSSDATPDRDFMIVMGSAETTVFTVGPTGDLTLADATGITLGTTTGTKIGTATTQKLGFFNATPVVQPTELTDELTSITHTAPGVSDYAIQDLTDSGGFGFKTKDEGNTVLSVILNLQTRVNELETKLVSLGLLADAD